jgi:hypothetical protein
MFPKQSSYSSFFLFTIFFLFGLFPILTFDLKPIAIIAALVFGLITYLNNKKLSFSKLHFVNIIIFVLYIISISYSTDKYYAIKKLETTLSLILIPLFFILISSINPNSKEFKIAKKLFYITFYFSSFLFCLLMFFYINDLGYFRGQVTYDYTISYIEKKLWGFNEHPIYISIFLSLSVIFSFKLFLNFKNLFFKSSIFLINLLLLSSLVFLSRKGVLIAFMVSIIFLVFGVLKSIKFKMLFLSFIFFLVALLYSIMPSSLSRINEIFHPEVYTENVIASNSTSLRIGIYKCAIKSVPDSGLFGFGIGDVKDILLNCFQGTSNELVKWKFNTHNQYLNTILACGAFGFSVFTILFFRLLKFSYNKRDHFFFSILLLYSIVMFTENILDRQNGVILYSFLTNFYVFINHSKKINSK